MNHSFQAVASGWWALQAFAGQQPAALLLIAKNAVMLDAG